MQPGDVMKTYANTMLLENLIDFKPQVNLENGISKFSQWYKEYYKI